MDFACSSIHRSHGVHKLAPWFVSFNPLIVLGEEHIHWFRGSHSLDAEWRCFSFVLKPAGTRQVRCVCTGKLPDQVDGLCFAD